MLSCGAASAQTIAAFCWRITRHNTLAVLADLYPQWLVRDLLPLPPSGGIPREAKKPSATVLRCAAGLTAAGRSLPGPRTAIEAAMVAARQQHGDTMATIGTFTAAENGYTGSVKTLTLNVKAKFVATEKDPRERHIYRVKLDGSGQTRLSQTRGTHRPTFSPDFKHYVDVYSDIVTPPKAALFDATGKLENWWTKDDFAHFAQSGDALVKQYSAYKACLLYTSPSPRDRTRSRMPSSACKKKMQTHTITITHSN